MIQTFHLPNQSFGHWDYEHLEIVSDFDIRI
jgi:hypothetical protein